MSSRDALWKQCRAALAAVDWTRVACTVGGAVVPIIVLAIKAHAADCPPGGVSASAVAATTAQNPMVPAAGAVAGWIGAGVAGRSGSGAPVAAGLAGRLAQGLNIGAGAPSIDPPAESNPPQPSDPDIEALKALQQKLCAQYKSAADYQRQLEKAKQYYKDKIHQFEQDIYEIGSSARTGHGMVAQCRASWLDALSKRQTGAVLGVGVGAVA